MVMMSAEFLHEGEKDETEDDRRGFEQAHPSPRPLPSAILLLLSSRRFRGSVELVGQNLEESDVEERTASEGLKDAESEIRSRRLLDGLVGHEDPDEGSQRRRRGEDGHGQEDGPTLLPLSEEVAKSTNASTSKVFVDAVVVILVVSFAFVAIVFLSSSVVAIVIHLASVLNFAAAPFPAVVVVVRVGEREETEPQGKGDHELVSDEGGIKLPDVISLHLQPKSQAFQQRVNGDGEKEHTRPQHNSRSGGRGRGLLWLELRCFIQRGDFILRQTFLTTLERDVAFVSMVMVVGVFVGVVVSVAVAVAVAQSSVFLILDDALFDDENEKHPENDEGLRPRESPRLFVHAHCF